MFNIYNIVSLLYIVKWMDPVGEQLNKTCQWISGDSPPAAWRSLDFIRAACPPTASPSYSSTSSSSTSRLGLRPQPWVPDLSGECWTSPASARSQWALPDLNRKCKISDRMSDSMSEHMWCDVLMWCFYQGKALLVCLKTKAYHALLFLREGGLVWWLTEYMSE